MSSNIAIQSLATGNIEAHMKASKGFVDQAQRNDPGQAPAADIQAVATSKSSLTGAQLTDIDHVVTTQQTAGAERKQNSTQLTNLAGKPVFASRGATDEVKVRNGTGIPLGREQLLEAARDFICANVEPFHAAEMGAKLGFLTAGNNGTTLLLLDDKHASAAVRLMSAWNVDNKQLLVDFDPARHAVVFEDLTGDEPHMGIAMVDKITGEGVYIDEVNLVDLSYVISRTDFETTMGKSFVKFVYDGGESDVEEALAEAGSEKRDQVADRLFDEYIDGYVVQQAFVAAGENLGIYNGENSHPLGDQLQQSWSSWNRALDAVDETRNYDLKLEANNGWIPAVETRDLVAVVKHMYEVVIEDDYKVVGGPFQDFRAVSAPGDDFVAGVVQAMVTADPRGAGKEQQIARHLDSMINDLGPRNHLVAYEMTASFDAKRSEGTVDASFLVVVNRETGVWTRLYARPEVD